MARSPWQVLLILVLTLTMFLTGCVSSRSRSIVTDESVIVCSDTETGGAEKARHHNHGVVAALFVAGAILILGAVIIDLIILPWSIPNHRAFCCCDGVVHVCYR